MQTYLLAISAEVTRANDPFNTSGIEAYKFLEAEDDAQATDAAAKFERFLAHKNGGDLYDVSVGIVGAALPAEVVTALTSTRGIDVLKASEVDYYMQDLDDEGDEE